MEHAEMLLDGEVDWDQEEEEEEDDDNLAAWQMMTTGPFSVQSFLGRSKKRPHGGSREGKSVNVDRRREKGHEDLWSDYFCEEPTYDESKFRRRFRMSRRLFNKILAEVCVHDSYFQQKNDATGKCGLSPHQKLTATMRQLAYGIGADSMDEYCRIAETTTLESLYRFCKAIRLLYEEKYLQNPGPDDFKHALSVNEKRGFPGMFGSLDCMHWLWKNCPVAWQGQYNNKDHKRSLILEAIADQELWIWHAYFGVAGGNNDINVLDRSPLLNEWICNDSAASTFTVNGTDYNRAYLLVDGIYPQYTMFIPSVKNPQTDKMKHFAKCQEACRKDVERAFGVLQARFEIVKRPARSWYESNLMNILMCCVVLHNMIIEDERGERLPPYMQVPDVNMNRAPMPWLDFLSATAEINNKAAHYRLRDDIVDHLWARKGSGHADV